MSSRDASRRKTKAGALYRVGHYSYHGRLKQRIHNGELVEIREEREPFALRFFFADGKSMPIRPYRVAEYLRIPEVRERMPGFTCKPGENPKPDKLEPNR